MGPMDRPPPLGKRIKNRIRYYLSWRRRQRRHYVPQAAHSLPSETKERMKQKLLEEGAKIDIH
jgi:hypothetical protein